MEKKVLYVVVMTKFSIQLHCESLFKKSHTLHISKSNERIYCLADKTDPLL